MSFLYNLLFVKLKYAKSFCLLIIIAIATSKTVILAQNSTADSLKYHFNSFQENNLQEKLFVHFDKQIYSAGEISWFKIYLVDAFFNKPLGMSKIAYLEILDNENKYLLQTKVSVENGYGSGSFQLPITIKTGNYKIRAYTNWMKNNSPEFFFENNITIINIQKPIENVESSQKDAFDLQFFPEGGNLVSGLKSKVAFRITNQNGIGQACNGVIVNNKSDTLVKFQSLRFGIGSFYFTPNTNEKYIAIVTLSHGKQISENLPTIYNNGTVMALQLIENKTIKVIIQSKNNSQTYLLVHTKGVFKQILTANSQNNTSEFLINKSILGDGISHFTLFDHNKKPIAERLFFKKPENNLEIDLTSNSTNYGKRENVKLDISTINSNKQPIEANLSMSVFRLDSLYKTENINSFLLLTSDLQGNVESSDFYFGENNPDVNEATDNLMLTHGWRRFKWDNILQKNTPYFTYLPEIAGHLITGNVTNKKGELAKNLNCYISMPSTRTQFHQASTNNEGAFTFDTKDFYNEGQIIIQSEFADSSYNFQVYSPFSVNFSSKKLNDFTFSGVNKKNIELINESVQVQNTFNGSKLRKYNSPSLDTTAFYGKSDFSYLLDNYVRFTTMEEVLREYVLPIGVKKRNDSFQLQILDNQKIGFFEEKPLLLLDGVPIFDFNKFMAFDPLKVRKLDVVTGSYYLGNMTFSGIANFITYSGDMASYVLDQNATVIDYEGIQLQREFYSPIYDNPNQIASRLPDFRNQLYWNPSVITDKRGKKNINFYASDLPGKYLIMVQGLSNEGNTGYSSSIIHIK